MEKDIIKANVDKICDLLDSKKGNDITIINISHLSSIADYFIIACAKSTTQVRALAEYVEDTMAKDGMEPIRKEGYSEGRWAVIDYGDFIVHIFHDQTKLFFSLDELWGDGHNITKYSNN